MGADSEGMKNILRRAGTGMVWITKEFGYLIFLLIGLNLIPIVYVAFAFYSWWVGILTLVLLGGAIWAVVK